MRDDGGFGEFGLDALGAVGGEAGAEFFVGEQHARFGSERLCIIDLDQEPVFTVADESARARRLSGDHRKAVRPGLNDDVAERFEARGKHANVGGAVERGCIVA